MWVLFFIKLAGCVTFLCFIITAKDIAAKLELVVAVDVFAALAKPDADCCASAM
jgi:hypothetical protein